MTWANIQTNKVLFVSTTRDFYADPLVRQGLASYLEVMVQPGPKGKHIEVASEQALLQMATGAVPFWVPTDLNILHKRWAGTGTTKGWTPGVKSSSFDTHKVAGHNPAGASVIYEGTYSDRNPVWTLKDQRGYLWRFDFTIMGQVKSEGNYNPIALTAQCENMGTPLTHKVVGTQLVFTSDELDLSFLYNSGINPNPGRMREMLTSKLAGYAARTEQVTQQIADVKKVLQAKRSMGFSTQRGPYRPDMFTREDSLRPEFIPLSPFTPRELSTKLKELEVQRLDLVHEQARIVPLALTTMANLSALLVDRLWVATATLLMQIHQLKVDINQPRERST